MNIAVKTIAYLFASLAITGCNAGEVKAGMSAYGYRCASDDGHVYSIVKKSPSSYVLYIQNDGSQADESDITFDGSSITDIETNGGVGKQAEVEKLFKLMLGSKMVQIDGGDYSTFLKSTPVEQCKFSYQYNLSP